MHRDVSFPSGVGFGLGIVRSRGSLAALGHPASPDSFTAQRPSLRLLRGDVFLRIVMLVRGDVRLCALDFPLRQAALGCFVSAPGRGFLRVISGIGIRIG